MPTAADGQAPVWHEDVRHFQIADETGMQSPTLFGSLQSPSQKRGGVDGYCIGRAKITHENGTTNPKAGIWCATKLRPDGKPSLMTFSEVETYSTSLVTVYIMLTTVDYPGAAGINNVGRGGTAQPVHGKLVLSSRNLLGMALQKPVSLCRTITTSCWLHA